MERHADVVFLSALTVAEISYGVILAPEPKRTKLREFIERLCREHRDAVLPVNEAVLVRWKQLLAGLKASGRVLSCEDSLLAAHALELGFGVATLNANHFKAAGVRRVCLPAESSRKDPIRTTRTTRKKPEPLCRVRIAPGDVVVDVRQKP